MSHYDLEALLRLMANLRDPEHGCPWDRKQELATIVPNTLDEVYEVIDAIERADYPHLRDELGDLLFQVVFYAQICAEEGRFDFRDVVSALVEKLLRRHPHVYPGATLESFGQGSALDEAEIKRNWERIKAGERADKEAAAKDDTGKTGDGSVLTDIAPSLPALLRAHKLQKRAASMGFDWQTLAPVLDTLDSEVRELREAIASGDRAHIADELGDLFFTGVNLARHLDLDSEQVLRGANRKFEQRFRRVESLAADRGLVMADAGEAELDRLWRQAKAELAGKTGDEK